ncbi:hypothetical protein A9G12_02830 [Gilliamella sp. wkB112]|nr:hypothetical protein A9G12_02830 [Gilliamella apicola]
MIKHAVSQYGYQVLAQNPIVTYLEQHKKVDSLVGNQYLSLFTRSPRQVPKLHDLAVVIKA